MTRTLLLLLLLLPLLSAQEFSASLTLHISDPANARVPGANAVLISAERGVEYAASSDARGSVAFGALPPGDYELRLSKTGFREIRISRISLAVRDRQTLQLELTVAQENASVTVTARAEGINTDPSIGVSMDQEYFRHLPLNGRSAESLVLMAPGVTSASGGRGGIGGGFNANGLRSNMNYYTLDGVSINSAVGGGAPLGGPGGGAPGGAGGGGASTDLISVDAMQELRVQTSPFAPEFGRSPGAQISMTSRSGTNEVHGSLFYYFRNEKLEANDWFANSRSLPRGKLRQNRPGGTIGGPIIRNRTYFFASYEGLRLVTPNSIVTSVPDLDSRRGVAPSLRPFLNAFPLPNGPALDEGAAEFNAVVANPSSSDSASLRLDHAWDASNTLFARYSVTPSSVDSRGGALSAPNIRTNRNSRSQVATVGWSRSLSSTLLNDLRVNISNSRSSSFSVMDGFGGATPLTDAQIFPAGIARENAEFSLQVLGLGGISSGSSGSNAQDQINIVNTVTHVSGEHTQKAGIDFRRIMPTNRRPGYNQSAVFNGISGTPGALLSGAASNIQVTSNVEAVYPVYTNLSAYWQDSIRAAQRTTLTFGLRWDLNPAPGVREGEKPLALGDNGEVTQDRGLYNTRWFDIAPRIGLAYQMDTTPGREMVARMGIGLFYDVGYGASSGAFGGAPYSNARTISLASFPLDAADAAPPILPAERPYGQLTAADRDLRSPLITQWNFTIERYFRSSQVLSIGYSASTGRRLLRTETQPSFTGDYALLRIATNGATSDYHGLQVQFRRRFSAALQTQFSYTYGHSIDSSSNDAGFGGFATLFSGGQRGSSDYDIRHNLNWSGSYRLLKGWYADWVATYRTGLPFDVQGLSSETSDSSASPTNRRGGVFAQVRPDYNGQPLWLDDPSAPGGRRLNRDAFEAPEGFAQGNLGRNAIRGFNASQIDIALRRQFRLREGWQAHVAVQGFNVLNQANVANPTPNEGSNLASPTFGLVNRTLGQIPGGGANAIYRNGGPRSVELSLRIQF